MLPAGNISREVMRLWSTLSSVKMHALCEDALILPKPGSDLRELIERTFTQQGLSIRPLLTIPDGEVIKQMVIKGIGATLVPAASVQHELLRGEFVRIPVPKLEMRSDMHLLWRNEKQFSPVARAFRNVLHREVHAKEHVR